MTIPIKNSKLYIVNSKPFILTGNVGYLKPRRVWAASAEQRMMRRAMDDLSLAPTSREVLSDSDGIHFVVAVKEAN